MAHPVPGNFGVRTRTFLLVPLRVFVGVVLLLQMYDQWDQNWVQGDGLRQAWEPGVRLMFFAPLREFLTKYVLARSQAAGGAIMVLELLVGVFLIIGLYVRLASLVGMVVSGLQLLILGVGHRVVASAAEAAAEAASAAPQGWVIHTPEFGLYGLLFLSMLVFFLTGAGKSFGVDGMVWRRRARRLARAAEAAQKAETPSAGEAQYPV